MKLFNIVCLVLFFGLIRANNIYIDIEEDYDDVIIPATLIKPATLINRYVGDIWTNCTTSTDDAEILKVSINPDPPIKGQNITVYVLYNLKINITSGKIDLKVKFGFITVIHKYVNLCQVETCPIPAADNKNETITELIPGNIPSGHYTAHVVLTDQNNKEVICIDVDMHL